MSSDAILADRVEDIYHDGVEQLCNDLEKLADYFGLDAVVGVRSAMERDALNMKRLDVLQQELIRQGRASEAQQLKHHSHRCLETSLDQLVKMRRHVSTLSDLVVELPECVIDSQASALVLHDIRNVAAQAFAAAAKGHDVYAEANQELIKLCEQFQDQARTSQQRAEQHTCAAAAHANQAKIRGVAASAALAAGSVGGFVSAASAAAAAGTQGAGLTVLVDAVAKPAMFVGSTSIAVGAGATVVFAVVAWHNYSKRCEEAATEEKEKKEAEAAKQNKRDHEAIATRARSIAEVTDKTSQIMDYHKFMWQGISMSADEARSTLELLAKSSVGSNVSGLFNKRMNTFGEKLNLFVKAIDKYMLWLSKTNYFPPTFDVRSIIGVLAHDQLSAELGLHLEPPPARHALPAAGTGAHCLEHGFYCLRDSLFQAPDGNHVRADRLSQGDVVASACGSLVSVVYHTVHAAKDRMTVELHSEGVAPLVVVGEHRIVVPGPADALARDLKPGDQVLCGIGLCRQLTQVTQKSMLVEVVEVRFTPDEPVAVHFPPPERILTLGQSRRQPRHGDLNRRNRAFELPDTEYAYSG